MKVPIDMIGAGLMALANGKHVGASCTLTHTEMQLMPDQILEARVSRVLTDRLGHQLGLLSEHHEVLLRAKRSPTVEETVTEFTANVVVMRPKDHQLLCRLLRTLMREHAP